MKATVTRPVEIEIGYVPVRYGEEDIPNDFPLRKGDTWTATVNIDTGKIMEWPADKTGKCDLAARHQTTQDVGQEEAHDAPISHTKGDGHG